MSQDPDCRHLQSSPSKLLEANLDDSVFEPPTTGIQTLRFANGDMYQGETLADLRHGKGKHTCFNGDTHDGGWYKGMRHGRGLAEFARGFVYEGEFQYDHADGFGKAKYENGAVFEGEFEADKRQGWGTQVFPDESVYVGEWAEDKMTGKGRITMKGGSFYEGSWMEGERVEGRCVAADKRSEYSGQWKGAVKHGQGTFLVEGVFQYTGAWEADLQQGLGKCKWADGSSYDGLWQQGNRHGRGKLTRPDGYKYDGEWQADIQNGEGNARFENGDRYTGKFEKGVPHGLGRMVSSNADRYQGQWAHGKKHGAGRCLFANGDKYQGEWVEGKRQGGGSCQFADGILFHGEWQEDQWMQSEAEPSLCRVCGSGLSSATAGIDAVITIKAHDHLGNRRLSGGDTFLVWLEGPATVHANVKVKDTGVYTATYNLTISGMYSLYITNDTGEAVAEAPFPLRVVAATPDPRKSVVKPQPTGSALVGREIGFEVEARDKHGNKCELANLETELPLEFDLTCGTARCEVKIVAQTGGLYSCTFVASAPGFYRLLVTSLGKPLQNSPVSIQLRSVDGEEEGSRAEQGVVDRVMQWEQNAARQYADDGVADGWESDDSQPETAEQRYIREHPEVPVVENLEDMWKVTKLQQERKGLLEKQAASKEMVQPKAETSEPPKAGALRSRIIGGQGDGTQEMIESLKQSKLSDKATESSRSHDTHISHVSVT